MVGRDSQSKTNNARQLRMVRVENDLELITFGLECLTMLPNKINEISHPRNPSLDLQVDPKTIVHLITQIITR